MFLCTIFALSLPYCLMLKFFHGEFFMVHHFVRTSQRITNIIVLVSVVHLEAACYMQRKAVRMCGIIICEQLFKAFDTVAALVNGYAV